MDFVRFFDTTLRDGEQSPGFSMDVSEKLRMARQLAELGVDVIEAGFPIASEGDLAAVRAVARDVHGPIIAALARAKQQDVEAALRALEPAARPRVHVFLATSDLHLRHKLGITRAQALEAIDSMTRFARARCPEVEFSAEDASRTDLDFLCESMSVAARAGATILNIPDTVGYSVPDQYAAIFRRVREYLNDAPGLTLSAHCHNDLGLAVANSLAAVAAGARQVECTINGIGERAGNASLEEIAVALAVRREHFGVATNLCLEKLYSTSRLLSSITGVSVPPNKAVVGANAFAHEAGIHQDGVLKDPRTYEIMRPQDVGQPTARLVLGRHSGRHAVQSRCEALGFALTAGDLDQVYCAVIALTEHRKAITDGELQRIVERHHASSGVSHSHGV